MSVLDADARPDTGTSEREKLIQLVTTAPKGFDNRGVASGALNVLIGTVRTAAQNNGTATVVGLAYRLLRVVATLDHQVQEMLKRLLARAASHARGGKKTQLEWKPADGVAGYQLTVRSAS